MNIFIKDTGFFDLFDQMGTHIVSSAHSLRALAKGFPRSRDEARHIHDEEHEADDVSHQVLVRLDHTFLPPIDREDVHALTSGLDDIIDFIDDVARRFDLYHVEAVETGFVAQTDVLVQAATAVNDAVHRLRHSRRLNDLGPTLIEIHRQESLGDDNHHAALARLFDGTADVLYVIKWKELHTLIEQAIDACEDVGNVLERIVLKG